MHSIPPLVAAVFLAFAIEAVAQGPACPETRPDSLTQATPPIYRECDVTRPAERQGEHRTLNFRSTNFDEAVRMKCLRASVGFVVSARGRVEEETVALLETNSPEFGRAVLANLGRLRYQPAELNGQPVRQWAIYHREGKPTIVGPIRLYPANPQAGARPMSDQPRVTVGAAC